MFVSGGRAKGPTPPLISLLFALARALLLGIRPLVAGLAARLVDSFPYRVLDVLWKLATVERLTGDEMLRKGVSACALLGGPTLCLCCEEFSGLGEGIGGQILASTLRVFLALDGPLAASRGVFGLRSVVPVAHVSPSRNR